MPNGPNGNLHYDFEDISNTENVPDSRLDEGTGQLYLPVGRVTPGDVELERVSVSRLLSFVQGTLGTHPTSLFRTGTTAPDAVDKREGIAQLYLYQMQRPGHGNLFSLYYQSGVLDDDWERITPPQGAPFWEYSADGVTWHTPYHEDDTLGRYNKGDLGGQNPDLTSPDAQTTPAFVIHQPVEPAETTEFGLANMENEPVGTAQTGTLGQVWNFPATTATAPRHYFNVPAGKRVLHILNVALGGAQETRNEWQPVTIGAITRYVRQPPMGRTGQYRVIFE